MCQDSVTFVIVGNNVRGYFALNENEVIVINLLPVAATVSKVVMNLAVYVIFLHLALVRFCSKGSVALSGTPR